MIDFIKHSSDVELLVITPLRKKDKIDQRTIDTISSNDINFDWISFSGDNNPYKNIDIALKLYKKTHNLPKYIIKVDNDIIAKPNMLDNMKVTLDKSSSDVGYTYCSFRFTGAIRIHFGAKPFSKNDLFKCNYISSISMMKSDVLEEINGVVTDDKYFRLLDWALWLKFLRFGYIGEPTLNTSFVAYASGNSVSAGSHSDYVKKSLNVYNDFIKPIENLVII